MSPSIRKAPLVALAALALALPLSLGAQAPPPTPATLQVQVTGGVNGAWGPALNVVLLLTLLTLVPAILASVTSFTRIIISLHFLRQAIGTQTAPSNQVLIGLALFLTFFVMAPVGAQVNELALKPLMEGSIDGPAALERGWPPLREFLERNTRASEIELFEGLAGIDAPEGAAPPRVLIPAFLVSEIRTAFQIGVLLYLPFLMIELIVASVLLALGMMQLPPIVISTPLKLVLFVVVDGWGLVIGALVRSVH